MLKSLLSLSSAGHEFNTLLRGSRKACVPSGKIRLVAGKQYLPSWMYGVGITVVWAAPHAELLPPHTKARYCDVACRIHGRTPHEPSTHQRGLHTPQSSSQSLRVQMRPSGGYMWAPPKAPHMLDYKNAITALIGRSPDLSRSLIVF